MPNKKSAEKELRKNVKRNAANHKTMKKIKDLVKVNLKTIKAGDKKIKEEFSKTVKALDKAVKTGLMKKNTASRKKSRIMKKINTLK
ncbi:MAG: 30S ribosomal protein S20 [Patescibacteria group bacterium]